MRGSTQHPHPPSRPPRRCAACSSVCVCHALYTTIRRCAVNRHPLSSRPGSRHMRRQRSAGRDSRHCHGHTGETHLGSSYPTTTPPGRFGRPRCNSVGHASSPLSEQAGQEGFSTRAHPSIMARPAAGRHHGAHATPHPQARAHAISVRVAWPAPRAAAAGAPGGPRAHSARNAHTARQRSPPAPPAHMVHMSCRRRAYGPRWSPRDARLGCCSARASTRQRQVR